jgi:hypothetical protein
MFTVTYKSVQLTAPERRYLTPLQNWFDDLQDWEVKTAISAIRWREMRPSLSWFRLIVVCRHPHPEDVESLRRSKEQHDPEIIDSATFQLLTNFEEWIESAEMARDTIVDGRQARITWSAQELPYFDMESFNPQEKAQYDLNRQGLTFLWLVEVSAQPEEVFVGSMTGMNMPFTAAGLLLTGDVRMINRFPQGFPGTIEEKESLHDNLLEHPADFMILIRLAHHFGCRQPIVKEAHAVRDHFLQAHAAHISKWRDEYNRVEDTGDFLSSEPVIDPKIYELLDPACESYRQGLLKALQGHEEELAKVLLAFLPELPVPDGPLSQEPRDESDWWKTGEE